MKKLLLITMLCLTFSQGAFAARSTSNPNSQDFVIVLDCPDGWRSCRLVLDTGIEEKYAIAK